MNGHVAQTAALAICGNYFLQGCDLGAFWPKASVFKYQKRVRFVAPGGGSTGAKDFPYAKDPNDWFSRLRAEGVGGLILQYYPVPTLTEARKTGIFVGGGGRLILATLRSGSADVWEPKYGFLQGVDPQDGGWDTAYTRIFAGRPHASPIERNFEPLRREFAVALGEIEEFARAESQEEFAQIFRRASGALSSPKPVIEYYPDIDWLDRLPLSAKQLLMAAQIASVFAGMGSWNDISFTGAANITNRKLSDRVFGLLMQAIVESANASYCTAQH